ncbi:MAG: YggS family pyridoxal phosphate-dependent enzyme [Fimbriimonadales bacterium]|nr:YggS family pyridoxal phosphate-dependent enzyme [Fimbriimonadales bacterium]
MSSIRANLLALQERITAVCLRIGRDPSSVQLVAVSKGVPVERIREAYVCGLRAFGENYWQEARDKIPLLPPDIEWHFIGHLQTNKVKYVVGRFHLLHVVDRVSLMQEIQRVASNRGIVQPVLIEVRLSDEAPRAGVSPEETLALAEAVLQQPNLSLQGLMGIAPLTENESLIRQAFRTLRQLFEQLPAPNRRWLSMGMSHDFEIALEEGSNLVRIGTALFGARA